MIVLDVDKVSASRPDRPLFTDLSLTMEDGDRVGIVGINGCGKSTLLRMIAGDATPESGVVRRGRGVRIAFLGQQPVLTAGTVRTAAIDGIDGAQSWEAEAVLDRLGMGALLDADVRNLSGGQAKRVALARALVSESELLILDEPTNHLDLDAIAWLEDRLARFRGALLMVTHDRHVLDRVCTKVLEIDRGSSYVHVGRPAVAANATGTGAVAAIGGYQAYLEGRDLREERSAVAEATRANLAKTELAWLRRGAPARTRKPKAHIESATALISAKPQAAARAGGLEFGAALARSGEGQGRSASSVQGSFRQGADERMAPRLGNKVIDLFDIGHSFDTVNSGPDQRWLFRGLDWLSDPGGRYGIVGNNGTGKSTLLEIIAGRLAPLEGRVEVGPTVRIGYYDQLAREFDPQLRVRDAVAGDSRPPGTPEDKKLMEQFWFGDDLQFAQIGTLSGGERRRLQLLLVLAERPNVLLLDEPTNDLDLDTLRMIESFLEEWPGTLIVVSHDRAFMDRTVEDVIAIEGTKAAIVAGGYAGWRENRASNLKMAAEPRKAAAKAAKATNTNTAGQSNAGPDGAAGSGGPSANQSGANAGCPSAVGSNTAGPNGSANNAGTNGGGTNGQDSGQPGDRVGGEASARGEALDKATNASQKNTAAPVRSSSTLRFLLKEAEKALAKATKVSETAQAALDAALASGGSDHSQIAKAGEALAEAHSVLSTAEEHWLEIATEAQS